MPRQRSAELCIPAEEEAFLRSLGWQECEDEDEGTYPVPVADLVTVNCFVSCKACLHDIGQARLALPSVALGINACVLAFLAGSSASCVDSGDSTYMWQCASLTRTARVQAA